MVLNIVVLWLPSPRFSPSHLNINGDKPWEQWQLKGDYFECNCCKLGCPPLAQADLAELDWIEWIISLMLNTSFWKIWRLIITWTGSPWDSFCFRIYCQEILLLVGSTAHRRWNSTWACPHTCWWCMGHWTEKLLWIDHVHHMTNWPTAWSLPWWGSHAAWHNRCSPRSCRSRCSPLGWQTVWLTYSEPPASPRLGSCPPGQGGTVGDCEFCVFYLASLQTAKMILLQTQDHKRRHLWQLPLLFAVLTRYCFLLVLIT